MNKVFLVIVVLLISINAFSQSGKDVVHLKNGSVITGYIIEERPNVSVTVKSGENTFVFKIDEVEKITRQSLSKYEMKSAPLKIKCDYPNKGYRGFGELSFGKGVDKNDNEFRHFAITVANGYQVSPKLFVGGGLGLYDHYDDNTDVFMIPVFYDIRFDMIKAIASPFMEMRMGYSVGDNEGVYFAPSIGLRLARFQVCAGYLLQGYNYETTIKNRTETTIINRTETEIGYLNSLFVRVAIDWGARRRYVCATD